jgi:hypothetical protein
MRRFACTLGSLALATFASAPALADCIPGTAICASAGVGIPGVQFGGQISVGLPQLTLPQLPQLTIPGIPAAPAYPSYGPPQGMYGQPGPQPMRYYPRPAPGYGTAKLALDLRLDGAAGFGPDRLHRAYGLGGAGIGLRYRAFQHLGFEGGIDVLGGRDYNDDKRVEVAGTAGALLYVNPRSRAQVYLSGGMLGDFAHATDGHGLTPVELSYAHVGGYAGLGLEMFATRRLAFHVDARGFARERVGSGAERAPEFTDPGTGRTTNTSAGMIGTVGMLLYF